MNIAWTEEAWKEYTDWQARDYDAANNIANLINDIILHDNSGLGKHDPLKHEMSGMWSISESHT